MPLKKSQRERLFQSTPRARSFERHRPRAHRDHDHAHNDHGHSHSHRYDATQDDELNRTARSGGEILVIRPSSGLSGDMMLAGLASIAGVNSQGLCAIAVSLGLPPDCVTLERRAVNEVFGWGCRIALPDSTDHRTWSDIQQIIAKSGIDPEAKRYAEGAFRLLAETEGRVHGIPAEQVHFHEVGALDSILDICLCAQLFARLAPMQFVCGPLPLCDGTVKCEHGLLPAPAPAVFELLKGVPVHGIPSIGETVTPTAIALLKAFGARFGAWPEMTIRQTALVYGGRVLPGVANGALFASGATKQSPNSSE